MKDKEHLRAHGAALNQISTRLNPIAVLSLICLIGLLGTNQPLLASQAGSLYTPDDLTPGQAASAAGVNSALDTLEQAAREEAVLKGVDVVLTKFDNYIFRQKGWITIGDLSKFRERLEQDDVQTFIDSETLKKENALAMYVLRYWSPSYANDLVLQIEPSDFDPDINNNEGSNSILLLWHEMVHAISHGHQIGKMNPSRPFHDWSPGMSDAEAEAVDHRYTSFANNMLCTGLRVLGTFEDSLVKLDRDKPPASDAVLVAQKRWRKVLFCNNTRFDFKSPSAREFISSTDRASFKQMTGYDIDEQNLITGYLAEGYRSEPFGLVATFDHKPVRVDSPKQIEFDATDSTGALFFDASRFDATGNPNTWTDLALTGNYPVKKYYWVFDADGKDKTVYETTDAVVSHPYDAFGTYRVVLFVSDVHGYISSSYEKQIAVEGIDVSLSAQPLSGNAPLKTGFNAKVVSASHPQAVLFLWDFDGDGVFDETDNGEADYHGSDSATCDYKLPGTYTAAVQAIDALGHSDTAYVSVTVDSGLTAVLKANPASGPPPLPVNYSTAGSGTNGNAPTDLEYDLNGNGIFNEPGTGEDSARGNPAPTYTYDQPGSYIARVRVTDDQGNQAEATATVTVAAGLVAHFTISPNGGPSPLKAEFDASGSTFPAGESVSYIWDFDAAGQGLPYQSVGNVMTLEYPNDGVYTITLKLRDSKGTESPVYSQQLVVGLQNVPPTAAIRIIDVSHGGTFDSSKAEGMIPLRVKFSAAGSTDPDGAIARYTWYFDDWTQPVTTTDPEVWHEYTLTSIFKPTVIVTDDFGNDSSNNPTVSVKTGIAEPELQIDQSPDTSGGIQAACTLLGTYIDARTTLTGCRWSFGDNSPFVETTTGNATHTFSQPGTYEITVDVSYRDSSGGTATVQTKKTVQIGALLTASLTVSPGSGPPPLKVTCDASGSVSLTGSINHYIWDIIQVGGPSTSNEYTNAVLVYTFPDAGEYIIRVTACDETGNQSTPVEQRVVVGAPLETFLTATPDTGAPPLTVQLTADATTSSPPVVNFEWDLDGDGKYEVSTGTVGWNSISYNTAGDYIVGLRVTDSAGQVDTTFTSIAVADVSAILTVTPTTGAIPLPVSCILALDNVNGNPVDHYTWEIMDRLGEITTSTTVTPDFTTEFTEEGDYTIFAFATDAQGTQSRKYEQFVKVNGPPVPTLASLVSNYVGVETEFDAIGSYSPNGDIVSYEWDLYGQGFVTGGIKAVAVYNTAGTHTVRLRVTDELGLSKIATTTILIEELPVYDDTLPFGTKAPVR